MLFSSKNAALNGNIFGEKVKQSKHCSRWDTPYELLGPVGEIALPPRSTSKSVRYAS